LRGGGRRHKVLYHHPIIQEGISMSANTCVLSWFNCKRVGAEADRDPLAVKRCYTPGARVALTTHAAVAKAARRLGLRAPLPHYSTVSGPTAGLSSIDTNPKISA
jgi:hypothetical protein